MTTIIFPTDRDDAKQLARRLLEAAGPDRHDEVQTLTPGPIALAFEVPEDLAHGVLGTGSDQAVVQAPGPAGAGNDDQEQTPAGPTAGGSDAGADEETEASSSPAPRARGRRAGGSS